MKTERKALIVGIDNYLHAPPLRCAESDAELIAEVLERNGDRSKNFTRIDSKSKTERDLLHAISELFKSDVNVALFYFSGHGALREDLDETIIVSSDFDGKTVSGIRINDILHLANKATHIPHKFIILDCCNSGGAGDIKGLYENASALAPGVTLICSTEKDKEAIEKHGVGQFSKALHLALEGGAANILGDITSASVYSYIESILSTTQQRPIFKANLKDVISLRTIPPRIEIQTLLNLPCYFDYQDSTYNLTPEFEPDYPNHDSEKTKIFFELQQCNRQGLIEPVDAKHMYGAAMNSRGCRLTALGKFYFQLVESGAI